MCVSRTGPFVCIDVGRKQHTRVELRVDGLDEPLLAGLLVGVLDSLEDDDAGDLLRLLTGALGEPADGDLRGCQFLGSRSCTFVKLTLLQLL